MNLIVFLSVKVLYPLLLFPASPPPAPSPPFSPTGSVQARGRGGARAPRPGAAFLGGQPCPALQVPPPPGTRLAEGAGESGRFH